MSAVRDETKASADAQVVNTGGVKQAFEAGEVIPLGDPVEVEITTVEAPRVGDVLGGHGAYIVVTEILEAVPFSQGFAIYRLRARRLIVADVL